MVDLLLAALSTVGLLLAFRAGYISGEVPLTDETINPAFETALFALVVALIPVAACAWRNRRAQRDDR